MAADAWKVYNSFKEYMADGTIDMDNDAFKMALFDVGSNATSLAVVRYGSLTSETANANGYTTGGKTLTSPTWVLAGSTVTFDGANVAWTASGGSITVRYAVIYDDTVSAVATDANVCMTTLDNTPADVTVTDGNTLTVQINASGVFTLSGAI